MKRAQHQRERTVSVAESRAAKARDRQRDWDWLARGEVTPEQLQEENAAVKNAHELRIVNLREVVRHYRVMNRRHAARAS
ncbi:MAG: hypothetical protein FJ388_02970 [Verrucomicrobia bacterium]|nr:hypothetical protein [Verrucomicrobiota bacterium]